MKNILSKDHIKFLQYTISFDLYQSFNHNNFLSNILNTTQYTDQERLVLNYLRNEYYENGKNQTKPLYT